MTNYINIKNPDNSLIWEGLVDNDKYQELVSGKNKREMMGGFSAIFIPVSTNTRSNLIQDLFFPTTMTVKNIAIKIFALIADLFTLPIRLLTCIPRIIYNANREEVPLLKFLRDSGVKDKIQTDYVKLNSREISGKIHLSEGKKLINYKIKNLSGPVHFIDTRWHSSGSCSGSCSGEMYGESVNVEGMRITLQHCIKNPEIVDEVIKKITA